MDDTAFYDEIHRHLRAAEVAAAARDLPRVDDELSHASTVSRLWEQALRDDANRVSLTQEGEQ